MIVPAKDKLRSLRRQLGMTQRELAKRLGVTRITVARWETGVYIVPAMAFLAMYYLIDQKRKETTNEQCH